MQAAPAASQSIGGRTWTLRHTMLQRAARHRQRPACLPVTASLAMARCHQPFRSRPASRMAYSATASQRSAAKASCESRLRGSSRRIAAPPAAAQAAVPVPQTTDEAIILLERLQRVGMYMH